MEETNTCAIAEQNVWAKRGRAIAWTLVVIWAFVIFAMSAKSGLELDTGNGIISIVKRWLATCLSQITGIPIDPSPIGHFAEYFVFGGLLFTALRLTLNQRANKRNAPRKLKRTETISSFEADGKNCADEGSGNACLRDAACQATDVKLRGAQHLRDAFFRALAIAAAYAITDEIHQLFVPGRACDIADWIVDVTAAALAAGILYAIALTRQKRSAR